ncbi:MAG: hypothetical protein RSA66_09760 [Muribaculaceae bacterium]
MSTEVWLAVIAIVATPLGGWLGAKLMRDKYRVEIDGLKADLRRKTSDTRTVELNNVREGNDILMTQIVEPLKVEIKYLRNDLNKFRRAIEKISGCPHGVDCPVSRELLPDEKGGERTSLATK